MGFELIQRGSSGCIPPVDPSGGVKCPKCDAPLVTSYPRSNLGQSPFVDMSVRTPAQHGCAGGHRFDDASLAAARTRRAEQDAFHAAQQVEWERHLAQQREEEAALFTELAERRAAAVKEKP
jgi:hypothetical protein